MKIYYSLGFYIDPGTGRGTGSGYKINYLSNVCDEFRYSSYVFNGNGRYFFTKLVNMTLQWLKDLLVLLFFFS